MELACQVRICFRVLVLFDPRALDASSKEGLMALYTGNLII
jgi:hypothetical protein